MRLKLLAEVTVLLMLLAGAALAGWSCSQYCGTFAGHRWCKYAMSMMKLLTGVAALFLATGAAHATVELPKEMLGTWCRNQLTTHFDTYVRGTCEEEDDETIILYADHYVETHYYDDSCILEKVEKIASDTYLIYSHCKNPDEHIAEEAQIIDDQLVIRDIPES